MILFLHSILKEHVQNSLSMLNFKRKYNLFRKEVLPYIMLKVYHKQVAADDHVFLNSFEWSI